MLLIGLPTFFKLKTMNKFKTSFLLLGLIVCSLAVVGQQQVRYAKFSEIDPIDLAKIECIYAYSITDKSMDSTAVYFDILQIGSNGSKYFPYYNYQTDSVFYLRDIKKITTKEYFKTVSDFAQNHLRYITYKSYTDNVILCRDYVFIDRYEYTDSVSIDWQLTNDTLTIAGYPCRKATATSRGRMWTAYYTEDIPVSDGPAKFRGLPGLILQIEDSDKEHCFNIASIRNSDAVIYKERYDCFKTTRERFNKQYKAYRTDMGSFVAASGLVKDTKTGKPITPKKRKYFFNQLELE